MYVAPVEDIVLSHDLHPTVCSSLTIAVRFNSQWDSAIEMHPSVKTEDCINHIIGWYSNTVKTRVIHFSAKFLNTDPISSINIGANTIKLESAVCDLGLVLDKHFDMSAQVGKSASLAIRNNGNIRNYSDQPSVENLAYAFLTTKIEIDCIWTLEKAAW